MQSPSESAFGGYDAAFQELMALIESGVLSSVHVRVRLPDGTTHEIPIGESREERACILESLHGRMRAGLH